MEIEIAHYQVNYDNASVHGEAEVIITQVDDDVIMIEDHVS